MNPSTKNVILNLYNKGKTPSEISKELKLELKAVENLIYRNKNNDLTTLRFCENCGKEIRIKKGHRQRRFCNSKCKDQWWRTNKEKLNHKITKELTCKHCGKKFIVHSNTKQKYCCYSCFLEEVKTHGSK